MVSWDEAQKKDNPIDRFPGLIGEYTLFMEKDDRVIFQFLGKAIEALKKSTVFVMAKSKSDDVRNIYETHEVLLKKAEGKILNAGNVEEVPIGIERSKRCLVHPENYVSSFPMLCRTSELKKQLILRPDIT